MQVNDFLNFLNDINNKSLNKGATAADSMAINDISQSVEYRIDKVESVERSQNKAFALRVFVNNQSASVSSSDFSTANIDRLIEQAINMAKNSPADENSRLADPDQITNENIDLKLYDSNDLDIKQMIIMAEQAEQSMLAVDKVTNSEGSSVSYNKSDCALAATNGFAQSFKSSGFSMGSSAIATSDKGMVTDFDYLSTRFIEDLPDPIKIGKSAAEKAVKKLNPRKIPSTKMAVIFAPRVARRLLSEFASAISGTSIARGSSFLKNKIDSKIFNPNVNIIDDPLIIKGLSSRSFDVEGLKSKKLQLVDNGILKSWLLDLKSARKLGLQSTAHATKSLGSSNYPKATNLYIDNGEMDYQEMINSQQKLLVITDVFGGGVNLLTGDYSQGAFGYLIEKGEICYPVSEITIASNLNEMFLNLIPANDLEFKFHINSPSLFIPNMVIAGE